MIWEKKSISYSNFANKFSSRISLVDAPLRLFGTPCRTPPFGTDSQLCLGTLRDLNFIVSESPLLFSLFHSHSLHTIAALDPRTSISSYQPSSTSTKVNNSMSTPLHQQNGHESSMTKDLTPNYLEEDEAPRPVTTQPRANA